MKKTLTKSLTVIVAVVAILTSAAKAENTFTISDISGVSKLTVSGNVEVSLVQSFDTESLGVYNTQASSAAKIDFENDELKISSYSTEKLKVIVAVIDLSEIETYGNAVVHTSNTLSLRKLILNLNDVSIADLDLDVKNLDISTMDASTLKISGSSNNQAVAISGVSKLDATEFNLEDTYKLSGRARLFVNENGERTTIQNKGGYRRG